MSCFDYSSGPVYIRMDGTHQDDRFFVKAHPYLVGQDDASGLNAG